MNRLLQQFRYSFERNVVEYFATVSIGATGAPTLTIGKGISSITRNSAGNYTILLQDSSPTLLDVTMTNFGASAAAAPLMRVVSEQVSTAASPSLVIETCNTSGTATDPASGEKLYIRIAVRNAGS